MNGGLGGAAIAALMAATSMQATAQDVVVMRRVIAPAQPRAATPTPTPTPSPSPSPVRTYSWQMGAFGPAAPACGPTTRTQAATCVGSDGIQADAETRCTDPKPDVTEAATDYSTCFYQWAPTSQWSGSGACGTTVVQTRTTTCRRSDGTDDQAATLCAGDASGNGATSRQITDLSACGYSWKPAYGTTAPACGPTTRPVSYACVRSDQTVIEDPAQATGLCGPAPNATTDTSVTDYSTCTYSWLPTSPWAGSGACGTTVTQTRTTTCQRSDGTPGQDAGLCAADKTGNGDTTQTIVDKSACRYSWNDTSADWSSQCSQTATKTHTITCVLVNGPNASNNQYPVVADSYCDPAGRPSGATQTMAITSGCTYAAAYGAPYGTCSSSTSTRTNTLTSCTRSDNVDVTSANASGGYRMCAQTSTESCTPTYTPTYGNWSVCTPSSQGSSTGSQTGGITACTANDGANVATSKCGATSTSRACTISSYAATYGAYGTCSSAGSQSAPITSCSTTSATGETGTVASNLCPTTAQTSTKSCTPPPTHNCGSMTDGKTISSYSTEVTTVGGSAQGSTSAALKASALAVCGSMTSSNSSQPYLKYCSLYDYGNGYGAVNGYFTSGPSGDPRTKISTTTSPQSYATCTG